MNTDITVVDGRLHYGMEDCICHDGLVFGKMTCPACKGTQRTKGGLGKGRCRHCLNGKVHNPSRDARVTCSLCNGTHRVPATVCSTVPDTLVAALEFKVYRSGRPQTIVESLFGVGLFSCTDYGRHQQMSDDELIAAVRESATYVQATKISRDGVLCDHVGIFCNRSGYSVIAVHN